MASSIQPNFAAISTRHCSLVTVRYQGRAGERRGVAAAEELMGDTYYKKGLRLRASGLSRTGDRSEA